jgi:hypothetical protein
MKKYKKKDKVIIKKNFFQRCSTCGKSRLRNLSGENMQDGWIFCIYWNAPYPNNAICNFWSP